MTPEEALQVERNRVSAYRMLVRAMEKGRTELHALAMTATESGAAAMITQLEAAREDARFWNAEATRLAEALAQYQKGQAAPTVNLAEMAKEPPKPPPVTLTAPHHIRGTVEGEDFSFRVEAELPRSLPLSPFDLCFTFHDLSGGPAGRAVIRGCMFREWTWEYDPLPATHVLGGKPAQRSKPASGHHTITVRSRDLDNAERLLKRVEKAIEADWEYHDFPKAVHDEIVALAKALRSLLGT